MDATTGELTLEWKPRRQHSRIGRLFDSKPFLVALCLLPTVGLLLIFLNAYIPESPRFLLAIGRSAEAYQVLRGFGCVVRDAGVALQQDAARVRVAAFAGMRHFAGTTAALSLTALCWGFINFGLLLWMPANLVAKGYSMALSSELLAASALIALPTVFVAAFLYSRWSSKGALLAAIVLTALGLAGVIHLEWASASAVSPVWSIAVLIVGVNGIIAMLLPYAAESYPLKVRGRATGWAAACTKAGGLAAQFLGIFGVVPALFTAALLTLVPVLLSLLLVGWFCVETRGRDLRDLEMETVHAE